MNLFINPLFIIWFRIMNKLYSLLINEEEPFEILNIKNKSLRHAVTSLISVIVSTLRGIEYLTNGGTDVSVLDRIIKVGH